MINSKNKKIEVADQVQEKIKMKIDYPIKKGYMLRREINNEK